MYDLKKLDNNLQTLTVPMQGTKTVTVLAMVKTGSRYENKDNNGISHFLEHMFFKGTEKRPTSVDVAGELDNVGGEYNAFTGKEYTGFFVKVASEHVELALDVVSDILANSKFSKEEIEKEKGVIIEEINMFHDNPLIYIEDLFERCLYGDTPLGWDIAGPKENIRSFSREDFLKYFNSQYSAGNTILSMAGDISAEQGKELLTRYFGEFAHTEFQEKKGAKEEQERPEVELMHKDTGQANLSLGVRGYSIAHPDKYVVKVISAILGGSMSSRLFTELREKQGLAYYVRTQNEAMTDTGYITTRAGVPTEKIKQAVDIILNEYKRLTEERVGEEELQRIKDMIKGRSVLNLESSDHISEWYAESLALQEEVLTPEDFLSKIEKVTSEDIMRVAGDIFREDKLNLALIGPVEDKEKLRGYLKF